MPLFKKEKSRKTPQQSTPQQSTAPLIARDVDRKIFMDSTFRPNRGASEEFVATLEYILKHAVEYGDGVIRKAISDKNKEIREEVYRFVERGLLPAYDTHAERVYPDFGMDVAVLYFKTYLKSMEPRLFKPEDMIAIAAVMGKDEASIKQVVTNTINALEDSYQRLFYVLCEFFRKMSEDPIEKATQMNTAKFLQILPSSLVEDDDALRNAGYSQPLTVIFNTMTR